MLTFDQSIGSCCDAKVMSGMNTIFTPTRTVAIKIFSNVFPEPVGKYINTDGTTRDSFQNKDTIIFIILTIWVYGFLPLVVSTYLCIHISN